MKNSIASREKKNLLFCLALLVVPIVVYIVLYIGVNVNTVKLVFVRYESGKAVFAGFDNFKTVFAEMFGTKMWCKMLLNSIIVFLFSLLKTPLTWIVSYYIYKKSYKWTNVVKIILFIPSILSIMVTVLVYSYFTQSAIPGIIEAITGNPVPGLLSNPKTRFITLVMFGYWNGFGSGMIIYLNAMSAVSQSTVEAAELDGVSFMQEFFHITLPMIYSTFKSLFIVSLTAIFTSQFNLFEFYGTSAATDVMTMGYYLFKETSLASNSAFPRIATMGLIITCISLPITFAIRHLLDKIDPMEN